MTYPFYESTDGNWDIEKQTQWINTYNINPLELGYLCEKFPALQKSWNEFKLVYNLCESQHENIKPLC